MSLCQVYTWDESTFPGLSLLQNILQRRFTPPSFLKACLLKQPVGKHCGFHTEFSCSEVHSCQYLSQLENGCAALQAVA